MATVSKRERMGRQLQNARKRAGLSQRELASHLGVNQVTVHRWETKGLPFYLIDPIFWQAAKKLHQFMDEWGGR